MKKSNRRKKENQERKEKERKNEGVNGEEEKMYKLI